MVYQLRIYVCMHAPGYICLGLVLGRLPQINLFGVHYCVICCVVETKYKHYLIELMGVKSSYVKIFIIVFRGN